jgi:RNA polymerase sigma-70 factor (ECF subfamily)
VKATLDLDALIDAWRGPLIGLLSARGASYSEAIELVQDVFAEAWIGRERFRASPGDTRQVGAWLAGIALNRQRVSHRKRRPEALPMDLAQPQPADEESEAEHQAANLRAAIEQLPDRERAVVKTFYFEETSSAHVAALLGIGPRAVEGLLRRARARLKEILERGR